MPNWREAGKAFNEAREIARLEQERRRIAEEQEAEKAREIAERLKLQQEAESAGLAMRYLQEFNSLNLVEKLHDISLQVLDSMGEIEDETISSSTTANRMITLKVSVPTAASVQPTKKFAYEQKFGRHGIYRSHGSQDGPVSVRVGSRWGFEEVYVGEKIVGWHYRLDNFPYLKVSVQADLDKCFKRVIVEDSMGRLDSSGLEVPDSWYIGSASSDRFDPVRYSMGTAITMPLDEASKDGLGEVIDSLLVQSSAFRLPMIDKWKKGRVEAELEARRIESQIGTIIK